MRKCGVIPSVFYDLSTLRHHFLSFLSLPNSTSLQDTIHNSSMPPVIASFAKQDVACPAGGQSLLAMTEESLHVVQDDNELSEYLNSRVREDDKSVNIRE